MKGPNEISPWTAKDEADVAELVQLMEQHLGETGESSISVTEVKREVLDRAAKIARKAGWRVHVSGFQITASRP